MEKLICILFSFLFFVFANCAEPGLSGGSEADGRLLGVAVTSAAEEDFEVAFRKAMQAGMRVTTLSLKWKDLEQTAGKFDPDPNFLKSANELYPSMGTPIALEINPIDTVSKCIPGDIENKPFDDPLVIERYKKLLDWSFSQIPNLQLVSLTIGNEIDVYLGNDPAKWKQYEDFFKAVSAYAKSINPNIKTGAKITFGGLTGANSNYASKIVSFSDILMPTYYPVDEKFRAKDPKIVKDDFAMLTKLYQNRTIYFLEIGYPSSSICGSSEAAQADFISQVFTAWDAHKQQIKLLNFTFLTDLPEKDVNDLTRYYGIDSQCFAEYLKTLGLRTRDARDKAAYERLKTEAAKRNL